MANRSDPIDQAKDELERHVVDPIGHVPRLVLSQHVSGDGVLDRIADVGNRLIGSMYLFVLITIGIVIWLFAGNIVGFDKTPWPLLLTILNLPQLSIMISLQSERQPGAGSQRRPGDCRSRDLARDPRTGQDADPNPGWTEQGPRAAETRPSRAGP